MLNAKEYRAKAANSPSAAGCAGPNEIIEYRNLGRRFTELADNEEWVERNRRNTLHAPGEGPGDAKMMSRTTSRKGANKMTMRSRNAACATSEPR
jgi:hypothetical protein